MKRKEDEFRWIQFKNRKDCPSCKGKYQGCFQLNSNTGKKIEGKIVWEPAKPARHACRYSIAVALGGG